MANQANESDVTDQTKEGQVFMHIGQMSAEVKADDNFSHERDEIANEQELQALNQSIKTKER